jgi:hypothetical protein
MSPITTASGRPIGAVQPAPEPVDPEVAQALVEVDAAQIALEDAAADGDLKLISGARRRLDSARARVEQARAAIRGRERREQQEAERAAARKRAEQQAAVCAWCAEYCRRAAPVLAAREQVKAAEQRLADLGPRPRIPGVKPGEGWKLVELFAQLPDGLGEVAQRIGPTPTIEHDPTRIRRRTVEHRTVQKWDGVACEYVPHTVTQTGPLVEVELLSGDDRFDRLAQALDQLAEDTRNQKENS